MKSKNVLFLTLYTFDLIGGIEKVCRNFLDVFELIKSRASIANHLTLSLYDKASPQNNYKAFNGNKVSFALETIKQGFKADVIILSHIHLLIFAKAIRQINPKKRIVLIAHGIEVWKPLASWKVKFLAKLEIWAVSNYTANQLISLHKIPSKQISVLNNSLPKDFNFDNEPNSSSAVLAKYNVPADHKILLTTCRLSSFEQYKGYDLVLLSLKDLIKAHPNLNYFIVGKADENERERIQKLIDRLGISANVTLTGYVSDEELEQFYRKTDIFVMPSKSEGFGLVFIEAIGYGCNVIAGNADGSTDALLNGELGLLVDPDDNDAIYNALNTLIVNPPAKTTTAENRQKAIANFGFERYAEKVEALITQHAN